MLLMLIAFSITANAQSEYGVKELTVRLNNIGATANIEIKGTPGSLISVELLRPDTDVGQVYTENDLMDVFAGLDMLEISQNGTVVYSYVSDEENGIYTFRVSGEVDTVSYTTEDNTLGHNEPDVFFAEMWSNSYSSVTAEHLQGAVWLTASMLNGDFTSRAQQIKALMDKREPGRRYLYIHTDICQDMLEAGDEFLWQPEAVESVAMLLDRFFSVYYELGGELDAIYTDNEGSMDTWMVRKVPEGSDKTLHEIIRSNLNNITSDPFYADYIRPQLAQRGYEFNTTQVFPNTSEINELYASGHYTSNTPPYLIFCAVMDNYKNECLTKAIYEPAKKYFPEVYYTNYSSRDMVAADYSGTTHKYELGGDRYKAGTHSCPVLYQSNAGSPYLEVKSLAGAMRSQMLSTAGGKILPWVASNTYHTKDFYYINDDKPYWYEYLFHIALCNPDALLFYGPRYYPWDSEEDVNGNIDGMTKGLSEFNTYAVKTDAKTLVENSINTTDFMVSGMYTNGRNLWRITPDNTKISVKDFLKSDNGNPTFYVSGQTVTFPGGKILDNVYSEYGYWVETDAGEEPTITYDEVSDTCTITYRYYDEHGIELPEDTTWDKVYTVAIHADGLLENVEGMEMNVAKYQDSRLVSVEPLKSDIWTGKKSRLVSFNIKDKTDSKLLTWESMESLTPLMPALPWNYK